VGHGLEVERGQRRTAIARELAEVTEERLAIGEAGERTRLGVDHVADYAHVDHERWPAIVERRHEREVQLDVAAAARGIP